MKWIDIHRCMPPIDAHYDSITSAYQSGRVHVKTSEGKEFVASLQLYGDSIRGWNSDWWLDGLLSSGENVEDVVCWRPYDLHYSDMAQTFEEIREAQRVYDEYKAERNKEQP